MKKQRYRINFSKTEAMRFTGHLDLILTWERTFRRAGVPLAYSEGFSSRPLLNMAAPLPLGYTSTGEIGDFWLSEKIPSSDLITALINALPPGLIVHKAVEIENVYGPKLPSLVIAASYEVTLPKQSPGWDQTLEQLMNSSSLLRNRKGKTYDLRPLILTLELVSSDNSKIEKLKMTLQSLPGLTGRPDEVIAALDLPTTDCRICRTEILLSSGKD